MGFATDAVHGGQQPDPLTGAVMPPLHLSTTYAQPGLDESLGYAYSRSANPTRVVWEACLATLEAGQFARAFASGMAAIDAALSVVGPDAHVVMTDGLYGGTTRLFEQVLSTRGATFTAVEPTPEAFVTALRPGATKLVFLESPTNPLLVLTDIEAVAAAVHGQMPEIIVAVDNTFATPFGQRPLELGADLVIHSTTKYLGGHSDIVGGAVVSRRADLDQKLGFWQKATGAVPSPFDCWLLLRSVKTLPVRMRQHEANARLVADFLAAHPAIGGLRYPGRSDHPQHELARRTLACAGGVVTADLGNRDAVDRFVRKLTLFSLAESLGGVESLVNHSASMTHGGLDPAERFRLGITDGLVRFSVGLEDADDLIDDLDRALS